MPRAGLSRDAVIGIAVELIDADPTAPLTLAAVAARAGVAVPSLYKHVASLDALRDAVGVVAVSALAAEIEGATAGRAGPEALHALGHAIRDFAKQHPGLYEAGQPAPGRTASADYESAARRAVAGMGAALAASGVPADRLIDAVRILRSATHGFIALDAAGGFQLPEDRDESYRLLLEVVTTGLASLDTAPAE